MYLLLLRTTHTHTHTHTPSLNFCDLLFQLLWHDITLILLFIGLFSPNVLVRLLNETVQKKDEGCQRKLGWTSFKMLFFIPIGERSLLPIEVPANILFQLDLPPAISTFSKQLVTRNCKSPSRLRYWVVLHESGVCVCVCVRVPAEDCFDKCIALNSEHHTHCRCQQFVSTQAHVTVAHTFDYTPSLKIYVGFFCHVQLLSKLLNSDYKSILILFTQLIYLTHLSTFLFPCCFVY